MRHDSPTQPGRCPADPRARGADCRHGDAARARGGRATGRRPSRCDPSVVAAVGDDRQVVAGGGDGGRRRRGRRRRGYRWRGGGGCRGRRDRGRRDCRNERRRRRCVGCGVGCRRRRRRAHRRLAGDCRRRRGGRLDGKELQRVHVPLRLGGHPDTKVQVRPGHLWCAGAPGDRDGVPFGDRPALCDRDRSEVGERHGIAVGGPDREALPGSRDRPRERHGSAGGRDNGLRVLRADVDPAMLPGGVRVSRVEGEGLKHGPVDGPGPRPSGSGKRQCGDHRREQRSAHRQPPT
jgi:hypothetical protein